MHKFFLSLALALLAIAWPVQAQSAVSIDINRIQRATVLVMQTRTVSGISSITCVSSGTFVSRDGLILTNAHSTTPNLDCPGDSLIIALNVRPDEPPVLAYQALVVQADLGLDLALLRVSAEINGRAIDAENLSLPFVDLAEINTVSLDDTITVVGYPGLSDDPVAYTSATIQGFTAEPRGGEKAWVKFRAASDVLSEIPGTFSGGGAYNRQGQLIGVPTTAPLARQIDTASCARFQDTNGDNLINTTDLCVPLGGAINALRPSDFALPLIRSASLDLQVAQPSRASTLFGSGLEAQISGLFFAPSANNDMPTTVISNLPAGADSLYLFFDYAFMTPETVYELRVTIDGNTSAVFSLPPVRWSGGERGLWYIGLTGQTLPNGEYLIRLLVNGILAGEAPPLRVGGAPELNPTFRSIQFVLVEDGQMFGNGYILGVGTTVSAQFIYDNMVDGLEWTGIWYFNGQELQPRVGGAWASGVNGAQTTSFIVPNGLLPGRYRLTLYIEGRLSALADFTIAGSRSDARPRIFSGERFVVADTLDEALTKPAANAVTTPPESLYALFDWEFIAPGTLWQIRLSIDDDIFFDQVGAWSLTESGTGYAIRLGAPAQLPDGTYRLDLLINNILLRSITIEIGIGQLSIDPFALPEGVQLRGTLIDGETGLGVSGATLFILSAEFSVTDFEAAASQLYVTTVSDRDGRFQFSRPLQFTIPYSIIISADGYLPINADGLEVDSKVVNPLELTIYMTRG